MMKNECKIVKDLLPSYIERLTSAETNEFVENHIKNCTNCNETLEILKKGENRKEKKEDEKEINYLKKHNRKVKILSGIAIILTISIISAWVYKAIDYYKIESNYKIVDSIYNKYQEIKESKNYKLTIENKDNKKAIILTYKEDKMKNENQNNIPSISYSKIIDGENVEIFFQNDEPSGYSILNNTNIIIDNNHNASFIRLNRYNNREANHIFDIREEKYEGENYYVLKENIEEQGIIELWVNKQTLLIEREISKTEDNKAYYYENKFTWEIGNVKDEDIKMTEEEKEIAYKYIEEYPQKAERAVAKDEDSTQEEKEKALIKKKENMKKLKKLVDEL